MAVLICVPQYGGCGHIGRGEEWKSVDAIHDFILCPECSDDHAMQLTPKNFHSLTQNLSQDQKMIAMAAMEHDGNLPPESLKEIQEEEEYNDEDYDDL